MEEELRGLYETSLKTIKRYTGLTDLTNIEKFGLLFICRDILGRSRKALNTMSEIPEDPEAVAVFLDRFYDVPAYDQRDVSFLRITKLKRYQERGYDVLGEYFQLEQDRLHMP